MGLLDEENIGRYPERNFRTRKDCEEDIREQSEDDIINYLLDKAGRMGDPRINSLLESIKTHNQYHHYRHQTCADLIQQP